MRLARNLLAGGENIRARAVYMEVMELAKEHHDPVSGIELLISKTYTADEDGPAAETTKSPIPGAIDNLTVEGVIIENKQVVDGEIRITGYAEKNALVAGYLRKVMGVGYKPSLDSVKSGTRNGNTVSEFSISIAL